MANLKAGKVNNKYIFISYSSKDEAVVKELKSILENNDINVWFGPENIDGGQNYSLEIPKALKSENCAGVLLAVSKNSQESAFVQMEVSLAISKGKPILPVKVEECTLLEQFEFWLQTAQMINFFNEKDEFIKRIISILKSYLRVDEMIKGSEPVKTGETGDPKIDKAIKLYREEKYKECYEIFSNYSDNKYSLFYLGILYFNGYYLEENEDFGFEYFTKSAELGYPNAYKNLGIIYSHEEYGRYDINKAIECYEKGGQLGNGTCYYKLGVIFYEGEKVEKDFIRARECFEKSIENGCTEAYIFLGFIHRDAEGTIPNIDKAIECFKEAGNNGNTYGFFHLGTIYLNSTVVDQQIDLAISYLEKGADLGNGDCMLELGNIYIGKYSEEYFDIKKALHWFTRSTEDDTDGAFGSLARIYVFHDKYKNYKRALKILEEGLSKTPEDLNVHFLLGYMYENGYGVDFDEEKSLIYYTKAAELGSVDALNNLGVIYSSPEGLFDIKKAIEYFEKAADLESGEAYGNLGDIYYEGEYVEQDLDKAFDYYNKAYDLGNRDCCVNLGILHRDGECSVKINIDKAIFCFQEGADSGDSYGYFHLGLIYYYDYLGVPNYRKALEYFLKGAEMENADCMEYVGRIYASNEDVGIDDKKAVMWLLKAIECEDYEAYCYLANIYIHHESVRNYPEAIKLLEKAIEINPDDDNSLAMLGVVYDFGYGVEKNPQKAMEYYKKAAALGNEIALNNLGVLLEQDDETSNLEAIQRYLKSYKNGNDTAARNLALLYYYGDGVEQDFDKALFYFNEAVKLGNQDCYNYLGFIYRDGEGVLPDFDKAIEYFELAAENGDSGGYYCLGELYLNNRDLDENYEKAVENYKKGIELNDHNCAYSLALLYTNEDFGINYKEAIKLYNKAMSLGDSDACLNLVYLFSNNPELIDHKKVKFYAEEGYKLFPDNPDIIYNLALVYHNGYGTNINLNKAIALYEEAAKKGHSTALNNIGAIYTAGIDGNPDYKKAFEYYSAAAEQNSDIAFKNLGDFYYYGLGIDVSYEKAFQYYQKAVDNGEKSCLISLGKMYFEGKGVRLNFKKAIDCFTEAIEYGFTEAYFSLFILYEKSDPKKALEYLGKGAESGDCNSLNKLGSLYEKGSKLVKKDIQKAIEVYKKGYDARDYSCSISLAMLYSDGKYYNFIEAERICTELLDAGDTNGKVYYLIGLLYLKRKEEQIKLQGVEYIKKAIELGEKEAINIKKSWEFRKYFK